MVGSRVVRRDLHSEEPSQPEGEVRIPAGQLEARDALIAFKWRMARGSGSGHIDKNTATTAPVASSSRVSPNN